MTDIEAVGRALAAAALAKIDRTWLRPPRTEPEKIFRSPQNTQARQPASPRELATQKLNDTDLPQQEALRLAIDRIAAALDNTEASASRRIGERYDANSAAPDNKSVEAAQHPIQQASLGQLNDPRLLAGWHAVAAPSMVAMPPEIENDQMPKPCMRKNSTSAGEQERGLLPVPPIGLQVLAFLAAVIFATALLQ